MRDLSSPSIRIRMDFLVISTNTPARMSLHESRAIQCLTAVKSSMLAITCLQNSPGIRMRPAVNTRMPDQACVHQAVITKLQLLLTTV